MNLNDLKTRIQTLINNQQNCGLVLYPILSSGDNDTIRLADISKDAADELKAMLLEYLSEKFIENQDLHYTEVSNADNRKNTAFLYDLNERPVGLGVLNDVLNDGNREQFSFNDDEFDNIKGFVITIGTEEDKVALYKRHYHLNTLQADRTFGLFKSDHRFVKMKEDIIKLSKTADFIQIDDSLIITNLKALESGFGFEDVIRSQASANIQIIENIGLLENIEPLVEMAQELRQAKKIMGIKADSPVLQLPVQVVIQFVQSHRPIMRKFRLSEDGTRLKLDTEVSKKLFLSLLNDDLLTSELTRLYYAGVAKDKMEVEAVKTN